MDLVCLRLPITTSLLPPSVSEQVSVLAFGSHSQDRYNSSCLSQQETPSKGTNPGCVFRLGRLQNRCYSEYQYMCFNGPDTLAQSMCRLKLGRWTNFWKRDIPFKVNFMAQIPVIVYLNVFYSVKFRQEGHAWRVTGPYPLKKTGIFFSYCDMTGPSV